MTALALALALAAATAAPSSYRETRPVLRLRPIAVTRMACPGARMALEQRALGTLNGPVRMRFVEGDNLILTGNGGSIRLRR